MDFSVRDYAAGDEAGWLRCRVLAFLGTSYFDSVEPRKPLMPEPGFSLVAVSDGAVVGLMDVEVDGAEATIESVAVHPDRQSEGIARALLDTAMGRLADLGVESLDA